MAYTKEQQEVDKLFRMLPPAKIKGDFIKKFYGPAWSKDQDHLYCLTCGHDLGAEKKYIHRKKQEHSFYDDLNTKRGAVCPHCGKRITAVSGHLYNWWCGYLAQYQAFHNWQVIRMHYIKMHVKPNHQAKWELIEDNYQIWYNENGTRVTVAPNVTLFPRKSVNPLSQWGDKRVRKSNDGEYINNDFDEVQVYSTCKWFRDKMVTKLGKRHAYDCFAHVESIINNIRKVKQHPYFETLEKMNLDLLLSQISLTDIRKYKQQIRIAVFRNNYPISDWNTYKDMLVMMEQLHLDTHQPKYICPENFKLWHDKLTIRYNKIKEDIALQEKMKKAEQGKQEFVKRREKYFCIMIQTPHFHIRPIYSPKEMIEEGICMHHCVGGYYDRKDSLILVARSDQDERIATIEINLDRKEIIQIRGVQNKMPQYYNEINSVLKKRLNDILYPTKSKFKITAA